MEMEDPLNPLVDRCLDRLNVFPFIKRDLPRNNEETKINASSAATRVPSKTNLEKKSDSV